MFEPIDQGLRIHFLQRRISNQKMEIDRLKVVAARLQYDLEEATKTNEDRKQTIDALSAEKGKLLRKLGRS